jgi:cell volume regulation protein A
MPPLEPTATAFLLTTLGVLLVVSTLLSRASQSVGLPVALLFLLIGILAGSEGIGGIDYENYPFAFRLGTVALALILFDGGLNTPMSAVRRYIAPAGVLATVGVFGTAMLVGAAAHLLGFPWPAALLLGAIVSSTDAAAVFSVLRGSGIHLKRRVGVTLEVESGLNDPLAVILTTVLTHNLIEPDAVVGWRVALDILLQIVIGAAAGVGIGLGTRRLLARIRLPAAGLYAVLTLAIALLAYGLPTLLYGSGFLAVYVAAVLIGNGELPYRTGLVRVHDALAWLSQIAMFLVLGLLVFPSRLLEVAWIGLVLAVVLAVLARPLVVALCLLPFGYTIRDTLYVGWVGLRGAVPIILATFPVLSGAPGAERLFDVVFFIVVVNAILPGATVPWVTRKLGLESGDPPAPKAVLEIESMLPLNGRLMSFYIDDALVVTGVSIAELPIPENAAVTMLVRGQELIAPRGGTTLLAGDHVYIFARPEDLAFIQLMFGRPEED